MYAIRSYYEPAETTRLVTGIVAAGTAANPVLYVSSSDPRVVNGISVDWSRRLEDGDEVSVYPVFEAVDISPIVRLRPEPLRETRFFLDVHLGRLVITSYSIHYTKLYD